MRGSTEDRRVQFDFEVDFTNGGGMQGQGFRLDIDSADISDEELASYIVRDLRLLMVKEVRIRNKQIIFERHKRAAAPGRAVSNAAARQFVDLSHTIVDGMITYKGLPAPLICDFLSREASKSLYADGTTFQIGRIDMVANTGTYLDSPFHRFQDGADLAGLNLNQLAEMHAVVVRVTGASQRAVDRHVFEPIDVHGKAVLVETRLGPELGDRPVFRRPPVPHQRGGGIPA